MSDKIYDLTYYLKAALAGGEQPVLLDRQSESAEDVRRRAGPLAVRLTGL